LDVGLERVTGKHVRIPERDAAGPPFVGFKEAEGKELVAKVPVHDPPAQRPGQHQRREEGEGDPKQGEAHRQIGAGEPSSATTNRGRPRGQIRGCRSCKGRWATSLTWEAAPGLATMIRPRAGLWRGR